MSWHYWNNDDLILNLYLQPKACKDEWSGLYGDRLKLRITAPPVDGKANQHLISWLAKEFGVSKTACVLVCGESGRQKKIAINLPQRFPALPDGLEFSTRYSNTQTLLSAAFLIGCMMKILLSTKSILLIALCFVLIHPPAYARTMYRWVDEHGKVSFSDQVPPTKAVFKHDELDSNAQVIKVTEKAKTKAELEVEKQLMFLKKQQEQIIIKQKAHDKKLLSNFLDLAAMDATHKNKILALNGQEQELRDAIKELETELAGQQQKAAGYEIKNEKIPRIILAQIEATQKKIAQTKQELSNLQLKIATVEKEFVSDRARFAFLTQSKTNSTGSASEVAVEKAATQPGLFSCDNAEQCEKAWVIAKEFVKTNSVTKISIDTETLFMSEDPIAEADLGLSISKMALEGNSPQIFLDIRCVKTITTKKLCSSPKAEEIRGQFNDYIKTKLNTPAPPKTAATK